MSEDTPRLSLPLLQAGQAQKEIDHNEALSLIDGLLHLYIESVSDTPPTTPAPGQCWVVAAAAGGAWAGRDATIALWTTGGWRFVAPQPGMCAINSSGRDLRWSGTAWIDGVVEASAIRIGGAQVVGVQGAGIADPAGGSTVDSEVRATVAALLTALREHGLIAS